jgi:hypothetical protein
MKLAFFSGDALHQKFGLLYDEYAHCSILAVGW